MTEADFEIFSSRWAAAWEVYNAPISAASLRLAFNALSEHSIESVIEALQSHIRDPDAGRFPPKPADIIGKMLAGINDGRPGPEEAWAMCPMSERETAWMTQEMSIAAAACSELIDRGDMIAARKAFIEVYERAIKESRVANVPCSWSKSLGWDQGGRESPCNENHARKYLERLNHQLTATEQIEWLPDNGKRRGELRQ